MTVPCPRHPDKLRWATVSAAQREANRLTVVLGVPFRPYFCERFMSGCEWYHVTTEPLRIPKPRKDEGT